MKKGKKDIQDQKEDKEDKGREGGEGFKKRRRVKESEKWLKRISSSAE